MPPNISYEGYATCGSIGLSLGEMLCEFVVDDDFIFLFTHPRVIAILS